MNIPEKSATYERCCAHSCFQQTPHNQPENSLGKLFLKLRYDLQQLKSDQDDRSHVCCINLVNTSVVVLLCLLQTLTNPG